MVRVSEAEATSSPFLVSCRRRSSRTFVAGSLAEGQVRADHDVIRAQVIAQAAQRGLGQGLQIGQRHLQLDARNQFAGHGAQAPAGGEFRGEHLRKRRAQPLRRGLVRKVLEAEHRDGGPDVQACAARRSGRRRRRMQRTHDHASTASAVVRRVREDRRARRQFSFRAFTRAPSR